MGCTKGFFFPPSPPTPLTLQAAAQSQTGLLRAVQMHAGASGAAALSPAGRERGANSPMWPRVQSEHVQLVGYGARLFVARFLTNDGCLPAPLACLQRPRNATAKLSTQGYPDLALSQLQTRGQIGLLAPLSAPAGVERGRGRGGEEKALGATQKSTRKTTNKIKRKVLCQ